MHKSKLLKTEAIVLKRVNYSDANRYITLFTKDHGKVDVIAKGCRQLNSRKRASLEVFNHIKVALYQTPYALTLTETSLIHDHCNLKQNYFRLAQGLQVLEIVDMLVAVDESHPVVYHKTLQLLQGIHHATVGKVELLEGIKRLMEELGYGYPDHVSEKQLKYYIESVTDKKLRTKEYLFQ